MSFEARVHADVVFHEKSSTSFTVGSLSDHIFETPSNATVFSGVAPSLAENITPIDTMSTLALKNTGSENLTLAGVIIVPPGRMALLPTSQTLTVESQSGNGTYTAIWLG